MTTVMLALFLLGADGSELKTWQTDYAKALQEVQRTDRPLFIVFDSNSSAVGKMVHDDVFMNEQVEKLLAANYVRMFVDVETKEGKALAAQFAATEFPRIVIIDRSADWQVYRKSGNHSADEVASLLSQFRTSKLTTSTTRTVSGSTQSSYFDSTWSSSSSFGSFGGSTCRT